LLRFIRHLLRVFSYIFLAIHSLVALGLSAVIVASPNARVKVGWLPWEGESLGAVLAVFGLVGIILVFLAAIGRARILLMLFALISLLVLTRGFFFTPWHFSRHEDFQNAFHFVVGFLLAFIGAIPMSRNKQDYRSR
jgi:hypothetical protein